MIIGIVGFIGSGKGTVGDILLNDYHFVKDAFAKPLKDAVSIIFGWDRDLLEGDTNMSRAWREVVDSYWSEVIGREITPRLALQLFGTECIREVFSHNVWSASLIKRYIEDGYDTVITDCRFKNELQVIKDNGGYIFRVKRGLEPEWYNAMAKYNKGQMSIEEEMKIQEWREFDYIPHVSETDWVGANFDYVIENDGLLSELQDKVDSIMNGLMEQK